jgi:hypothetical protein
MLRRLRPLDRVLLLTLVPLWAVLFGLQLTKVLGRGSDFYMTFGVS